MVARPAQQPPDSPSLVAVVNSQPGPLRRLITARTNPILVLEDCVIFFWSQSIKFPKPVLCSRGFIFLFLCRISLVYPDSLGVYWLAEGKTTTRLALFATPAAQSVCSYGTYRATLTPAQPSQRTVWSALCTFYNRPFAKLHSQKINCFTHELFRGALLCRGCVHD